LLFGVKLRRIPADLKARLDELQRGIELALQEIEARKAKR
jgi:hypothetical protein